MSNEAATKLPTHTPQGAATLEVGKTYRLYGRMGKMRTFKAVGKDSFVGNLIYADLYRVHHEGTKALMEREINYLQGQGQFEYRYAGEGGQL